MFKGSFAESEPVGAGTYWSESEPVWRSGSILDKTEEIVNDILFFVHSHNNNRLFKKTNRYLKINKLPGISDNEGGLLLKKILWLEAYFL